MWIELHKGLIYGKTRNTLYINEYFLYIWPKNPTVDPGLLSIHWNNKQIATGRQYRLYWNLPRTSKGIWIQMTPNTVCGIHAVFITTYRTFRAKVWSLFWLPDPQTSTEQSQGSQLLKTTIVLILTSIYKLAPHWSYYTKLNDWVVEIKVMVSLVSSQKGFSKAFEKAFKAACDHCKVCRPPGCVFACLCAHVSGISVILAHAFTQFALSQIRKNEINTKQVPWHVVQNDFGWR